MALYHFRGSVFGLQDACGPRIACTVIHLLFVCDIHSKFLDLWSIETYLVFGKEDRNNRIGKFLETVSEQRSAGLVPGGTGF